MKGIFNVNRPQVQSYISTESVCINKDTNNIIVIRKKNIPKNSCARVFDHLVQNHGPSHSYITATLISI